MLEDALVREAIELVLELDALELVNETVDVKNPEETLDEAEALDDVVEPLTATEMTLAPQTPLLFGVPTALFK